MLAITLALTLTSGCAKRITISSVGLNGTLNILTPDESFTRSLDKGEWILLNNPPPASLATTRFDGHKALKIISSKENFKVVRPVQANLLATPFLEWSWNMFAHETPYHGVSIMVGFQAPSTAPYQGAAIQAPKINGIPQANRIISLRWSSSALERGFLSLSPGNSANAATYTVRGGQENTARWWRESVDLSGLYAKAWPKEDMTRASIVFIALIKTDTSDGAQAYFSDIRLFR